MTSIRYITHGEIENWDNFDFHRDMKVGATSLLCKIAIKNPVHHGQYVIVPEQPTDSGFVRVTDQVVTYGKIDTYGNIASESLEAVSLQTGRRLWCSSFVLRIRPCPGVVPGAYFGLGEHDRIVEGLLAQTRTGSRYWLALGMREEEWW